MFVFMLVVLIVLISMTTSVWATSTPYYTYTTDNEYGLYRTYDAYTPSRQITEIDGIPFRTLEYVFVDEEDYIYLTDSGFAKVFIFDKDMNFVDEISYAGDEANGIPPFFGVNSVYVTKDKIYVPDSFAKAVFVFDRNQALHRQKEYVLWMEDVDFDDELSNVI